MKVAIIGATGMVGRVMSKILEERNFPISKLIPVASARSVGQEINFKGQKIKVSSMETALEMRPDIALFSAGGNTSLEFAPKFAAIGTKVIDNSSAWRMDETKKLVVPEINGNTLTKDDFIIANPNCSTIQMVMALAPLHKKYNIERLVISTYQSISGTGKAAIEQLNGERNKTNHSKVYPHEIDMNCLPHCDVFQEHGYTKEELKLVNETHKILGDNNLKITATCVRVPVSAGHSESVNVSFSNAYELDEVRSVLRQTNGVIVVDNPEKNEYPMPLSAAGKDEVFVGRIRRDFSTENGLNLWIVSDNLRKGAATNTVQIAEYLLKNKLL